MLMLNKPNEIFIFFIELECIGNKSLSWVNILFIYRYKCLVSLDGGSLSILDRHKIQVGMSLYMYLIFFKSSSNKSKGIYSVYLS